MKESFGGMIAALRKEKGMTQLDLATKMGVTDKAVSKWERDLSFPDVASLPLLAEVLGVTVDELLQAKTKADESPLKEKAARMVDLGLRAVAVAMGVAVAALAILGQVDTTSALVMLGIGLACLAIASLPKEEREA